MPTFAPGDYLRVCRPGYFHHGIYVGDDQVVQFGGSVWDKPNATIALAPFEEFAKGASVETVSHPDDPAGAVKRALWLVENPPPRAYNVVGFNCEHVAPWGASGLRVGYSGCLAWVAVEGRLTWVRLQPRRSLMSVFSRVRTLMLACGVVAAGALGALVVVPTAGAAKVGSTYLAIGDSLTYGFHEAQFAKEYPNINPANYHQGFVDDFAADLKFLHPGLQVINDGCPGETTETAINGSGVEGYCAGGPTGTPFPYVWLHHPYTQKSQLADALSILATNHNVSPITVDLGANDELQFLEHTCGFPAAYKCTEAQVAEEFGHIASNLGYILGQLRAAAPSAQIVVIGNYNPYPTILPAPGGDKSLALLNGALASVTAKIPGETSFTSVEPYFNAPGYFFGASKEAGDIPLICAYTAMCPGGTFNPASPEADIHPTTLGYAVFGGIVDLDFWTH